MGMGEVKRGRHIYGTADSSDRGDIVYECDDNGREDLHELHMINPGVHPHECISTSLAAGFATRTIHPVARKNEMRYITDYITV